MTHEIVALIEAYRATGRIVFVCPRLDRISLNGGARMPTAQAVAQMRETVNHEKGAR